MNIPNKKGFTLVELLVVIAIIGILASIVVVSLSDQSDKANDVKVKANLRQLPSLAVLYKTEPGNGDYTDFFTNDEKAKGIVDNTDVETNVISSSTATEWAVAAEISDGWWCVDDTGLVGYYEYEDTTATPPTIRKIPTDPLLTCNADSSDTDFPL